MTSSHLLLVQATKIFSACAAIIVLLTFAYIFDPIGWGYLPIPHVTTTEIQAMTFALRMLHSGLILILAYYLYRSADAVRNEKLTKIFWAGSVALIAFFVARITAGVLDSLFASDIGWFSNLANVIFWSLLIYKARNVSHILESPRNDELRISLREDFDILIARIEKAKANVQALQLGK